MKPNPVQRDIQSRRARIAGEAPRIGRISRFRDPYAPEPRRHRRRGPVPSTAGTTRTMIQWWSGSLAVLALLVIGGFMVFWLRSYGGRTQAVEKGGEVAENIRVHSRFVSPGEDEALALVKKALSCRDAGAVEASFRLGDAAPADVLTFLAGMERRDGPVERFAWLSSMDLEGQLMEGVLVVHGDRTPPVERLAFLVPDEHGVWKVDFEAFARTSKPSWKALLEGEAERSRVRVVVARDFYFNGPFLEENDWLCFSMSSPEARDLLAEDRSLLRGYCKTGSPQARAMQRMFAAGNRANRATLEIARKDGADPRQFEIKRVLSEDWVLTPRPCDERYD